MIHHLHISHATLGDFEGYFIEKRPDYALVRVTTSNVELRECIRRRSDRHN